MKKIIITVTLGLLIIFAVGCGRSETADKDIASEELPWNDEDTLFQFRKAWWGMSMDEVRESEAVPPTQENEEVIVYRGKTLGLKSIIGYIFKDDSLTAGRCLFEHTRVETGEYISDFEYLKSAFTEKYGQPAVDNIEWLNPRSENKDNPEKALLAGDMFYYAIWNMPKTKIMMTLRKEEKKLQLGFEYSKRLLIRRHDSMKVIEDTTGR